MPRHNIPAGTVDIPSTAPTCFLLALVCKQNRLSKEEVSEEEVSKEQVSEELSERNCQRGIEGWQRGMSEDVPVVVGIVFVCRKSLRFSVLTVVRFS